MLKFQPYKDYDLSDSLKKSCHKILKILTVVACQSSCNPLWVLWNFRGWKLHLILWTICGIYYVGFVYKVYKLIT
jgi:hypothetical protein